MFKLGGLGVILTIAFLMWVISTPVPEERLDRVCTPVEKFGNVVVSLMALVSPEWVNGTRANMNDADYGCQYVIWRLFYEQSWIEEQQRLEQEEQGTPAPLNAEQPLSPPQQSEEGIIVK